MQYPQYSFNGKQSSARVPREGYSVFQRKAVVDSQLKSGVKSQGAGNFSQQHQRATQRDSRQGKTHNFSDQPATTWHWGSQSQTSQTALPIQRQPNAEHVPANAQSFAPPVDLGRLQRVERPQVEQQFASDIYKSPIDRPYMGKTQKNVDQSDAADEANFALDDATSYFKEQSGHAATMPERDEVTEAREFLSREESSATLFAESPQQEVTSDSGSQRIVLKSQSPQELAEARAKEASKVRPDAQLLTPNFELYAGSPVLDTTRDAYQEETQWKVYTPKLDVVIDLPPPAIFESLPKASNQSPVVEHSPPAPKKPIFEAVEEFAALPEPPPVPAPKIEDDVFQPPPAPVASNDVFKSTSNTPVNQVSVSKVKATQPSYRFERYEAGANVEANTTAMTVAHTTPVTPPAAAEPAWLSPWWMLVCLVPFAMYLATRRGDEVDEYYDAYDQVGDRPRLPQEMLERPGYSKSDAIYGEKDEYFATEQLFSKANRDLIAEKIPMATHLRAAGKAGHDLEDLLPAETVTPDSVSELRFASSNSVQTDFELDGNDSPNFRSQSNEADDGDDEIPDWLS